MISSISAQRAGEKVLLGKTGGVFAWRLAHRLPGRRAPVPGLALGHSRRLVFSIGASPFWITPVLFVANTHKSMEKDLAYTFSGWGI
jgi:hypothetical protein